MSEVDSHENSFSGGEGSVVDACMHHFDRKEREFNIFNINVKRG